MYSYVIVICSPHGPLSPRPCIVALDSLGSWGTWEKVQQDNTCPPTKVQESDLHHWTMKESWWTDFGRGQGWLMQPQGYKSHFVDEHVADDHMLLAPFCLSLLSPLLYFVKVE